MLGKLQKQFFFLIIFCLSFQVGLHFWPQFSYVEGIRIDYLSPTLYLLDVLIIGFILCSIKDFPKVRSKSKVLNAFIWLFLGSVIWNSFFAKSTSAHLFGIIKVVEFVLVAFCASRYFKKDKISTFVRTLSISAILTSILAIWQFVNQSSVGGVWYFLGERTFSSSTIGISTVNLGQQLLRSYAAFPHPNLLAFFLLMSVIFSTLRISHEKNRAWKFILFASILISCLALIFTFSRISIFLALLFFIYIIYAYFQDKLPKLLPMFGLILFFASLFLINFLGYNFLLRGIDFREQLFVQSFTIFQKSPYFGIGINNFFAHQASLIKTISPINFQPPHNIFVLSLLSFGILGWWMVPFLFFYSIRSVREKLQTKKEELKDFYKSILFVLCSIVVVGMFDHFFMTLEQGQIILFLILGLSFAKHNRDKI